MKRRSQFTKKTAATTSAAGSAGESGKTDAAQPGLQLQGRLKEVMCTNLCMSSEDVDKLFSQAQEN